MRAKIARRSGMTTAWFFFYVHLSLFGNQKCSALGLRVSSFPLLSSFLLLSICYLLRMRAPGCTFAARQPLQRSMSFLRFRSLASRVFADQCAVSVRELRVREPGGSSFRIAQGGVGVASSSDYSKSARGWLCAPRCARGARNTT